RLLPQEMVWGSFDLTNTWNLEAYYIWNWRPSTFISVGTLFSPFDFIGPGFNPDLNVPGLAHVGRDYADRGGQWDLGTRFIIERWNSAELGLFWTRSHGFIPYLQADFDPNSPMGPNGLTYKTAYAE